MFSNGKKKKTTPSNSVFRGFSAVPGCSGVFRGVPGCCGVLRGVAGCCGVLRCSGIPGCSGVPVFRCSGVSGFSTCLLAPQDSNVTIYPQVCCLFIPPSSKNLP